MFFKDLWTINMPTACLPPLKKPLLPPAPWSFLSKVPPRLRPPPIARRDSEEVDVSLRLETTCRSLVVKTGVGQPELLYTAVLAPERSGDGRTRKVLVEGECSSPSTPYSPPKNITSKQEDT